MRLCSCFSVLSEKNKSKTLFRVSESIFTRHSYFALDRKAHQCSYAKLAWMQCFAQHRSYCIYLRRKQATVPDQANEMRFCIHVSSCKNLKVVNLLWRTTDFNQNVGHDKKPDTTFDFKCGVNFLNKVAFTLQLWLTYADKHLNCLVKQGISNLPAQIRGICRRWFKNITCSSNQYLNLSKKKFVYNAHSANPQRLKTQIVSPNCRRATSSRKKSK